MSNMVQYGIWPNCCNNCDFCLRMNRDYETKDKMIELVRGIRENINYVDWKGKFDAGISLLGGEMYFVTDKDIQSEVMLLIDDIINKILKVSPNPKVKYSTVTNGLYEPSFLYRVIDRIVEEVGIDKVDVNFSYDLKYRFKNEEARLLCLDNINKFMKRYDYHVGVQMILTQYVIDSVNNGTWDIHKFLENDIPGGNLCFLYPHPIHTGKVLPDFQFKREDLLNFVMYLRDEFPGIYLSFVASTHNSGIFKYTGWRDKTKDTTQEPILSDGKEEMNPDCGHSILYKCYADSDACLECDLENFDR